MVEEKDRLKMAFTTKWGTFTYSRMPFRLINVGATFQRAMDFAFKGLVGKNIVIYMDDLIIYSKDLVDHLRDLRKILQRCREFKISLNPKKCIFGVTKGRLLGHIILKKGISIDPDRVDAIQKVPYPSSLKELWSFMGKINFVRNFIFTYAEIVKPLIAMMKKDVKIKWSNKAKRAFHDIKEAITRASVLTILDYKNPFYLYSFTSNHSIVGILT